ncbi:hypothetical protein [Plantactinospora sonchi]|uniref:Uncharacterized protein n=1 Tax=Plantactinospora sonchi TaxID=1544735 RepID=A0ABU7S4Q8_9ACTN
MPSAPLAPPPEVDRATDPPGVVAERDGDDLRAASLPGWTRGPDSEVRP